MGWGEFVKLGKKRMYKILKEHRPDVCKMRDCCYRRVGALEELIYSLDDGSGTGGVLCSRFAGRWMKYEEKDIEGNFLRSAFLSRLGEVGA